MILNFHGLDGGQYNTNYRLLVERYGEGAVYSPQIDYRNYSIESVVNTILSEISVFDHIDLVVGNSFGGFLGTIIAEKYGAPYILTNPCLRPDNVIDTLIPGYMQDNWEYILSVIADWRDSKTVFTKAHIIIGQNDEVLDIHDALRIAGNADIVLIPGTHRLSGQDFNNQFQRMEEKIEKSNSCE